MEEEKEVLTERVLSAIKNRKASELKEIFETVPNIDIAECLDEVDDAAVFLYIFRTVSSEYTGDFFTELTSEQQELIINSFTDKQLIDLLENSFADDIVDTLEEMPANVVNRVLKACPADLRKDVNNLLNYKDNTAGSVMTTEYLDMRDTLTVKEALKIIRKRGKDAETVYTVFVRDAKRNLEGTINLDDLIFADEDEKLEDIMDRDFVTCNVNDDQEEVANMFKRYDLNAMAVVNNENKIIGIITIDDVVDIIVEEATEDIAHLNQISNMDEPYLKTPVLKLVLKCVPWIIILIILQMFSTLIISRFEGAIASLTLLSFFMSLVTDAGGNAGGQTTTLIVRSISLDEFDKGDFWKVIWKSPRYLDTFCVCVRTVSPSDSLETVQWRVSVMVCSKSYRILPMAKSARWTTTPLSTALAALRMNFSFCFFSKRSIASPAKIESACARFSASKNRLQYRPWN